MGVKSMEAKSPSTIEPKRAFAKDQVIPSDLFKLEIAQMAKNVSGDDKKPIWQPVEHVHFYHTRCSDGKIQTTCSAVGGHKHEIKVTTDKAGNLIAKCSAPIGLSKEVALLDKHTHEMTYLMSTEVTRRVYNNEAQKFLSTQA
jgi:hypothetical protein